MPDDSEWIGWFPGGTNEHLTPEQLERVEKHHRDWVARRGKPVARVVVDVYENEAVPQVQFPGDCQLGAHSDSSEIRAAVERAAAALADWR
jgi:hypothetical protein